VTCGPHDGTELAGAAQVLPGGSESLAGIVAIGGREHAAWTAIGVQGAVARGQDGLADAVGVAVAQQVVLCA
jgi:hypothetical protein